IIEQWGKPNYVRIPFDSLNGERVEEWVFMDKRHLFQFINHEMVYEGPLTDYEQLLLDRGYPDTSALTVGESGLLQQAMVYHNIFLLGREENYNLANDKIVYSFEGN